MKREVVFGMAEQKRAEQREKAEMYRNRDATKYSAQIAECNRKMKIIDTITELLSHTADDYEMPTKIEDFLAGYLMLTEDRKNATSVMVFEGDSILHLMQKYADVKDCQAKMARSCEKQGLKMDFATGTIIKA